VSQSLSLGLPTNDVTYHVGRVSPRDSDCDNPDSCSSGVCLKKQRAGDNAVLRSTQRMHGRPLQRRGACTATNDDTTRAGAPATAIATTRTAARRVCVSRTTSRRQRRARSHTNECTDDHCDGAGGLPRRQRRYEHVRGPSDSDCDNRTAARRVCVSRTTSRRQRRALSTRTNATDDHCNGAGACTATNRRHDTCGSPSDSYCDNRTAARRVCVSRTTSATTAVLVPTRTNARRATATARGLARRPTTTRNTWREPSDSDSTTRTAARRVFG